MIANRQQFDALWLHEHGGPRLSGIELEFLIRLRRSLREFRRSINRQAWGTGA